MHDVIHLIRSAILGVAHRRRLRNNVDSDAILREAARHLAQAEELLDNYLVLTGEPNDG